MAHTRQSLWDIFTTPIGNRITAAIMDYSMTPAWHLHLAAALIDAAARFEPRVTLRVSTVSVSSDGHLVFDYQARTLDNDELTACVYLQQRR